jgi:hypothetical protein
VAKRKKPFVQVDKECINDDRLSWRAKGILVYLLSKPPKWQIYEADIIRHATEGRDAVRAAIKELEMRGYLTKKQTFTKGKFGANAYTIRDTPSSPLTDFQELVSRPLNNNDNGELNFEKTVTDTHVIYHDGQYSSCFKR